MYFYLYVVFSLILMAALIIFIITFGLPFFTGAPFAVSFPKRVKRMGKMASKYKKGNKAAELGSGEGRIVIELAKNGFDVHGYEINPFLAWFSKRKLKKAGIRKNVKIFRKNFWKQDFSSYDVVTVFGVFYMMEKLEKKLLQELKPGAIVLCNAFNFPKWKPVKVENGIYLYKK